MKSLAYVGIGSNLAHPRRRIERALADLARLPRSRVVRTSPNYVSAPIDGTGAQPDYVNAVIALRTALSPASLLRNLRAIETRHGRPPVDRRTRNTSRTLDLDLLLFDRRRSRQSRLTLPHPRMHKRAFVLKPLLDVARAAAIPGRGLARSWLRSVRGQRITRTRSHFSL